VDPSGLCFEDACVLEGAGAGAVYLGASALVAVGVCIETCGGIIKSINSAVNSVFNSSGPTILETRQGSVPPYIGPPNGWIQGPNRGRQYGPDGYPQYDIDKPHQGNQTDHAHNWGSGGTNRDKPGYPISPLPQAGQTSTDVNSNAETKTLEMQGKPQ
jgi:hypothetical protein